MFTDLPRSLYRYRPLKSKGGRSSADVIRDELDLIKEGHIWTSNPKDLNDPFDCRPISDAIHQATLDEMMSRLLIGSLSAVAPDDVMAGPMWCHYANDHRGICVEYPLDSRAGKLLPIYPVAYVNERLDIRSLDPNGFRISSPVRIGMLVTQDELRDAKNNIAIEEMTRKSLGWQNEQEWRYIWPANGKQSEVLDAEHERLYGPGFRNKVFISQPLRVFLGANMDPTLRDDLSSQLTTIRIEPIAAKLSETECRIDTG